MTGGIVFVAALPGDTLRTVAGQLDERGDLVVLTAAVAENGVRTTRLGTGNVDKPGWRNAH